VRLVSHTSLQSEWTARVLLSWPMVAALSAAALALPPVVIVAGFGLVSAAALREFSQASPPSRDARPWPDYAALLLVPMQYAFVALAAWTPAMWCLPLAAALGLPLLSVIAGDTRGLDVRSAQRFFAVMLTVYSLSYAPALLALDSGSARPADLLLFLVVVTLGSGALRERLSRERAHELRSTTIVVVVAALAGIALSWLTPFTVPTAALAAALAGVCAAFGQRVIALMTTRGSAGPLARIAALAFAAPVFFHLTRALASP